MKDFIMTDINRLKMLSGIVESKTSISEQLKADKLATIAAYDKLIYDSEHNIQLDEGLFTSLKATLATLGHLSGAAAKKVADTAKKIGADIKEIYLDKKAQAELEQLIKRVKEVIVDFEVIEKDASTIIKRDPEVAQEMKLFSDLLKKMIETLSVRLAASKSGTV